MPTTYDLIVLGGGPPGENVAARARRGGLSVCLVESRAVGGECSYWACIPTKAMLRPLHAVAATRRVQGASPGDVQAQEVFERRDSFTHRGDDSSQVEWLQSQEVDFLRGRGRLTGVREVRVETADGPVELIARHAVTLAVGSRAAIPPIPGLAEARPWTNVEAAEASSVPDRLLVIGGGVVGCEFAQLYAGLGSSVTVVQRDQRLLQRSEEFAATLVADALKSSGVDIRTGCEVSAVQRRSDGNVTVQLDNGEAFTVDEVLLALGRQPNTDDLGVETVGLEPGQYVEVDDSLLATGVDGRWLYAVGDVNGRNLLTHMGKYQARAAGEVIVARALGRPDDDPSMRAWADHNVTTQVIFTDPQLCSAGLTEAEARDRGLDVRVVEVDLGSVSGAALHVDGYTGVARLVVDEDRRVVIGATFVGQDTAELLQSAAIAIAGEVPLKRLWHATPPFPTMSEVWLRLLESYGL